MLSILIFAHVPPPHHGQSYMVAQLLAELRAHPDEVRVFHVDSRVSDSLEEVGRMEPGKVWRMLRYCWQAIRLRLRHGPMVFYYVPAPARRGALLRDWLVMALCRPFFRRRLVLHWHAVGLGDWLARGGAGPVSGWFSRRALGDAALSLVLARSVAPDAAVLYPKQTRILPNGMPDPCPDFDRTVLPARLARAEDRPGGMFRVLFMAHCTPEKGLYDALAGVMDAQRQLYAAGSSTRLALTVAGQFLSPQERQAFLDAVARWGADWPADAGHPPGVECVGFAAGEAKDRLLRESDVFCFPTYYSNEVMPVSLIEALAYGLPIVATRWRAIPETLPEAGCFLVDIRRPADVAVALRAAMDNRDFPALRGHFQDHYLREVFGRRFLTAVKECFPAASADAREAPRLRLALSILCENPAHRTGLTTFFHEFVGRSLELFGDVDWIVFAGPDQEWTIQSSRVRVVRRYPANDRLVRRLVADHFRVPAEARRLGADALLSVGFVPLARRLPTILHLFSLQHLDPSNRMGLARRIYRGAMLRRFARRAELVVTNTQSAARQIRHACGGDPGRMIISPEGLQHGQFTPEAPAGEAARLEKQFGFPSGYLLWASNFYAYKQASRLLDAYARLDADLRRAHPLVMVGGNWQGGADDARAHAAGLGLAQEVRFLGWVDDGDLAPLYRQARAFVLSSREETFGRCVIEAMACGTPCVVNDIPVMHEVTGGHALIVDFHDAEAAAAALRAVLTDDALHARLRAEGVPWTRQFTFERLAAERIKAIRDVLARPGANGR